MELLIDNFFFINKILYEILFFFNIMVKIIIGVDMEVNLYNLLELWI